MTKTVLPSAGGTDGHLFPTQSLAQELTQRGWRVHLATDHRAKRFVDSFPADAVHIVASATFTGKSPIALAKTLFRLARGYVFAWRLLRRVKTDVVVGFGGYPTVPPLLAAAHSGHPTVLHEQNAVMGRANRFLSSRISAIATGFALDRAMGSGSAPVTVTGNPLRQIAHDAASRAYEAPSATGQFKLLVFGGSQGTRFFSQVLPKALAEIEPQLRQRVHLTLQARPEDEAAARAGLEALDVAADVNSFFDDMPHRISKSHLVICRSGASSVSELALIGVPSILVPLPGALDDDQGANATHLEKVGGARLIRQRELTPQKLADELSRAMNNPDALAKQAENAKKAGVEDAAARLADLVETHAQ